MPSSQRFLRISFVMAIVTLLLAPFLNDLQSELG